MSSGRRFTDWLLRPNFEDDVDKTGMARLLNTFLLASIGAIFVYFAVTTVAGGFPTGATLTMLGVYTGVAVLAVVGLRAGYVRLVGVLVVLMIWGLSSSFVLRYGGIKDEFLPAYFVSLAAAGLILGVRGLLVFSLMTAGALGLAYYLEWIGYLAPPNPYPSGEDDLVVVLVLIGLLAYFIAYAARRIRDATEAYQANAQELREARASVAETRREMAADHARLMQRLRGAITVTEAATASVADIRQLLGSFVQTVAQEFEIYHVALFWTNPSEGTVVVQAASSVEGEQMLARGHRLQIGQGIVGGVAATGEARLVTDVAGDPEFAFNPNLPNTRCELAVPILVGDEVIGVLDAQSSRRDAFSDEDLYVLEALAHHVSLAIGQARLIENLRQDVEAAQQTYREIAREDWQRLLQSERGVGFVSTPQGTALVDASGMEVAFAQMADGPEGSRDGAALSIPVNLAGKQIAEVQAHLPTGRTEWDPEHAALAETLSEQLSQALERARLHRETQRRAVRELVLREITDEMGRASDMQSLLRITAESLNRSLGGSQFYVKLASQDPAEAPAGSGEATRD